MHVLDVLLWHFPLEGMHRCIWMVIGLVTDIIDFEYSDFLAKNGLNTEELD